MLFWDFSEEQEEEAYSAVEEDVPSEYIRTYFYPDVPAEVMTEKRVNCS